MFPDLRRLVVENKWLNNSQECYFLAKFLICMKMIGLKGGCEKWLKCTCRELSRLLVQAYFDGRVPFEITVVGVLGRHLGFSNRRESGTSQRTRGRRKGFCSSFPLLSTWRPLSWSHLLLPQPSPFLPPPPPKKTKKALLCGLSRPTSFPGSSPFLPREREKGRWLWERGCVQTAKLGTEWTN